ncbi:uncharacterized protein LMH87_008434 [Akanthomyces muscarius]|uniref:Uncharacterized protein n=1 Tax=Akanthomyces muscarius TaxID=2231603 RepID=A0A9W8QKF2_AKAMU|nr:uncharacterized protein LMH87_008434 [Akanthomyces muscarius]KAJ4159536.1 hypothetical protein LMH87_008434 [Akanthomyces muscarius]
MDYLIYASPKPREIHYDKAFPQSVVNDGITEDLWGRAYKELAVREPDLVNDYRRHIEQTWHSTFQTVVHFPGFN